MNHFSLDVMRKEKVRDLQREGMTGQAFHRSRLPGSGPLRQAPAILLALVGLCGLLGLFLR